MRYESLLLAVVPGLLRLLRRAGGASPREVAVVASVAWAQLGVALFSLLLPSSVVDPLMKDFIAKHTLEMMNQNLADCLFVLSFASLQLHGPAQRGDASAAKEMRALYGRRWLQARSW